MTDDLLTPAQLAKILVRGVWRGAVGVADRLAVELTHLAKGGTLWLVVRGYLPVHGLFVEPR